MNAAVFIFLAAAIMAGLLLNAYRMMKASNKMLEKLDRSKLNDLDNDGWDEPGDPDRTPAQTNDQLKDRVTDHMKEQAKDET